MGVYLVGLGGFGAGARAGVPSAPPRRRRRGRKVPAPSCRGQRQRGDLVGRGVVDLAGEPGEALPVGRDGAPHRRGGRHRYSSWRGAGSGPIQRGGGRVWGAVATRGGDRWGDLREVGGVG